MDRRRFVTTGLTTLAATGFVPPRAEGATTLQAADGKDGGHGERGRRRTLVLDVANDLRRFVVNGSRTLPEARRGDGFITEGKIYPGGTVPPGGTMTSPGPFDPDTAPGAIGLWVCRGTFFVDFAEILNGAEPHVFSTQYHLLNGGNGLVSEGPEGGLVHRSLVGGLGRFVGAAASVVEEPIGTNMTGLFNVRFTFRFETRS